MRIFKRASGSTSLVYRRVAILININHKSTSGRAGHHALNMNNALLGKTNVIIIA